MEDNIQMTKRRGNSLPYEKLKEGVLFEDKWCRLKRNELTIKCFYFPTGQNKIIDLNAVQGVYYIEQELSSQKCKTKGWGMSLSPCWWACDIRRNWHSGNLQYFNVVIDCGQSTYKGFTVLDMQHFLNVLRPLLQPDTIIKHELPF